MQEISLQIATDKIIDSITNSEINEVDKIELLINLYYFLTNYEEVIKLNIHERKKLK